MKIYGLLSDFAPVRQDTSRIVISFDLQRVDDKHCTWHEVCFYKKQNPSLGNEQIKATIIEYINECVRQRIFSTLVWNGKPVWLSTENQMDWKAAFDRALQTEGSNLPMKFKIGEDASGNSVYHTFTSLNAFADFTDAWQRHIQQCLADGWQMKDSIDWDIYANSTGL